MTNTISKFIAALMLIFMLTLAFFSMKGDSAIMDEVAHLPAGYSYITQADMRLNPEHPPLIKDLAGGAVWLWSKISGQPIYFPAQLPSWQTDINSQWDFGFNFMYHFGNPADQMLFFGRLPMLLILLILGIYVFKWTKELFGLKAGLLALFFYSFSPTLLAHGRFITTDVAAAAAIFIGSYYFIRWLKNPSPKNLIIAGLIFGLAQLAKFSAFLLVPLFCLVAFIWYLLKLHEQKTAPVFWPLTLKYLGGTVLLFVIGYAFIVWPVYLYHVTNYPIDRQQSDTQFILQSTSVRPVAQAIYWAAGVPVLRALAQYALGLAMVFVRATGGNTIYFLGMVYNMGWPIYFPFVYLVKEALAFHILTFVAIMVASSSLFKGRIGGIYKRQKIPPTPPLLKGGIALIFNWLQNHIAEFLMLCFITLYWFLSVRSPLNIGVRHILPTFPFIYLLVASQIVSWTRIKNTTKKLFAVIKWGFIGLLVAWQIISVIAVYPSFLAYFNEIIGGPKNGYKYVADSNLDWGQDLKRLTAFVEENKIEKIYVDYFGGGQAQYYLGDKFQWWWGTRSPEDLKSGDWLAVSATFLDEGRGQVLPGFNKEEGFYRWLDKYEPVTTIGYSIFVYQIP